jgi:hypothetical protein
VSEVRIREANVDDIGEVLRLRRLMFQDMYAAGWRDG